MIVKMMHQVPSTGMLTSNPSRVRLAGIVRYPCPLTAVKQPTTAKTVRSIVVFEERCEPDKMLVAGNSEDLQKISNEMGRCVMILLEYPQQCAPSLLYNFPIQRFTTCLGFLCHEVAKRKPLFYWSRPSERSHINQTHSHRVV